MVNYYLLAIICLIIGIIWFTVRSAQQKKEEEPETIEIFSSYSDYNPTNFLLKKLEKVNLLDPKKRKRNDMDDWFISVTPKLMHNGNCLAYINKYGYLEDSFWKNIEELDLKPEQDEKLQQLLISVHYNKYGECWNRNFNNLLFHYGKHYRLLPEIENMLNYDPRLNDVKDVYYFARESALK